MQLLALLLPTWLHRLAILMPLPLVNITMPAVMAAAPDQLLGPALQQMSM